MILPRMRRNQFRLQHSILIMLAVLLSWWRLLAWPPYLQAGTHFPVGSVGLRIDTIIEDAAQG